MNTITLFPATRSFGYAAALQAELARIGPLTDEELERRYTVPSVEMPLLPEDPLAARYGDIFRRDPQELLRERITQALDTLLPQEAGPSVPEAIFQTLFEIWDTYEAAQAKEEQWHSGQHGVEWEALVAFIVSHPLITIVAQWEEWERPCLQALQGQRFAAGSDLLAWLEEDEARRMQQIRQHRGKGNDFIGYAITPAGYGWRELTDEEVLSQFRQERLHQLHRYLTGHYGIHADFRLNDAENTLLRQNGFVVTQRLGANSFGDLYYHLFNNDLPVFVTGDSLLHAWHHSYDEILMEV